MPQAVPSTATHEHAAVTAGGAVGVERKEAESAARVAEGSSERGSSSSSSRRGGVAAAAAGAGGAREEDTTPGTFSSTAASNEAKCQRQAIIIKAHPPTHTHTLGPYTRVHFRNKLSFSLSISLSLALVIVSAAVVTAGAQA